MKEVEILNKKDVISVHKENGTFVDYYLFDEFEVHNCKIPPHSVEEFHKHSIIEEIYVVTKGDILVKWVEDNKILKEKLQKGSVLRVKKSVHTIENISDFAAEFTVFRFVPTGENKRELIKRDKEIIENV